MEALPKELLSEITGKLMLSHAARLAQTSKTLNSSIWPLIKTLSERELTNITENAALEKFQNLQEYIGSYDPSATLPQELSKLTSLQNLAVNLSFQDKRTILQQLTNLRQLNAHLTGATVEEMNSLLQYHTRLTNLVVRASEIESLNPLQWNIMTRLRSLKLSENSDVPQHSKNFFKNLWTLTQLRRLSLDIFAPDKMQRGISNLTNLEEFEIYACQSKDYSLMNARWFINYEELLDLQKLTFLSVMDVGMDSQHENIFSRLTQLMQLDLFDMAESSYKFGIYSNLTKLKRLWFALDIDPSSDPGLEFKQIPHLVELTTPWCRNITQLSNLNKLEDLRLAGTPDPDQKDLKFLQESTSLQRLSIRDTAIPSDGDTDLHRLTNLTELTIVIIEDETNNQRMIKFIKSLSVLPSLSQLVFPMNFSAELMPYIVALTQLRVVVLPNSAHELCKNNYQFILKTLQ